MVDRLMSVDTDAGPVEPQPVMIFNSGVGITASAAFTPVAGAYAGGDIIGASAEFAFTYADGGTIPAGSLIRILTAVTKIDRTAVISNETSYSLQGYSATQPSAQADNAAWTLASGDLTTYRGQVLLGVPVDLGAALYVKSSNIDLDIKLTTSSLWARLVGAGAPTLTTEAIQVLLYGIVL